MSVLATTSVWRTSPYKGGALLVHLALADFADEDGLCWPSVPTIAKKSRLGVRQVHKIINQLQRDGLLSKEDPGGGRHITALYRLRLNCDSVNRETVNSSTQKPCTPGLETVNCNSQNSALSSGVIRKNRQEPSETVNRIIMRRPSLDEVRRYCEEIKSQVDPQKWFDYYSSNGWKVGRNPMRDWHASVRTWESNSWQQSRGQNGTNRFTRCTGALPPGLDPKRYAVGADIILE